MMDENQIQEIESETHFLSLSEGNKWNKVTGQGAVASLPRGRRSHLVFAPTLPKGREPNGRVRLRVVAMRDHEGKLRVDRNGDPLFRGTPAPVMYEDRWRQNPDGTLVKETWSKDWLLNEVKRGETQPRLPVRKDGEPITTATHTLMWGSGVTDSVVVKTTTGVIPVVEERPHDVAEDSEGFNQLGWYKIHGTERPISPIVHQEMAQSIVAEKLPLGQAFLANYPPELKLKVIVTLAKSLAGDLPQRIEHHFVFSWGDLPKWFKDELQAPFPICKCGKLRFSVEYNRNFFRDTGEYSKCHECRLEESCWRCGNDHHLDGGHIRLVDGQFICQKCENRLPLETLVHEHVSTQRRQEVVDEAKRLLSAQALEREVGEMVLEATLGHITNKRALEDALRDRTGYAWYYWSEDGVYGSKFSPEALQLLCFYAKAKADGLITFTAWLASMHQKTAECDRYGDFYWRTQVKGESLEPTFSGGLLGQPLVVATKVLGKAADRTAALAGHQRLVKKLGNDELQVYEVWQVLCRSDQDYGEVLQKIAAAEEELRQKEESDLRRVEVQAKLPELLQQHYPTCPLCEQPVVWEEIDLERVLDSSTGTQFCNCLNQNSNLRNVCQALDLGWGEVKVGVEKRNTATVIRHTKAGNQVVVEVLVYHKYGQYNQNIRVYSEAFGAGEWKSGAVWQKPSDTELQIFKLEGLRERYPEQVASAEIEIQEGQAIKLQFRWEDRDNKKQLVAGNRKSGVLYMVDRKLESTTVPGKWYYCSLDRTLVDTETFKLHLVRPYLQANLNVEAEIAKLQAELKGTSSTSTPPQPAQTAVDLKGVNLKDLFGGRARKR